jgi:hypothetical protein
MSSRSDWKAVHEEMTAEDRRRLGEPPTTEEMLAYSRGELGPEEAQRVRALLVCNPELARALMQPFPTEDARPGDADYLPQEEVSKQWQSLQKHIRPKGRVLQFPSAWTALAAALALVFAGLFWQAESKVRQLSTELTQPRAASEEQLLLPDGSRGGSESPTLLTAEGESVLLVVPLINQPQFGDYRLEIIADTRLLWASDSLHPRSNDSFAILVPRAFLKSGKYQVALYGVRAGAPRERLETYSLRVP